MNSETGSNIEIHEDGDWAAVYLDGRLIRVGDAYLADEWLRAHFGVTTVQDDAFLRGQTSREGVAKTLDEVRDYAQSRQERLDRAAALRAEAQRLEDEAQQISETPSL